MDEAAESPNCSVCSHSRNASHFVMQCFYTGIPAIQKNIYFYIYKYIYQAKAHQNYTAWQSQHRDVFMTSPSGEDTVEVPHHTYFTPHPCRELHRQCCTGYVCEGYAILAASFRWVKKLLIPS